jgi:predicted nuclease of predicted toxin-antitoxin system
VKFKLDENIGRRGLELLRTAGHDVMTVLDQGLAGATDERLFATCAGEGRALITLDHDFGQVTRFPPERSAGVVVLEAGPRASVPAILDRLRDFLAVLETRSVVGSLWVVEPGRVRIHLRDPEE